MGNGPNKDATKEEAPRKKFEQPAFAPGSVLSWGWNAHGQLGHGDTRAREVPTGITSFHDKKARWVACGQFHTLTVTESGDVYSCGRGDVNGGTGNDPSPRMLSTLKGCQIVSVSGGRSHSHALTSQGQLYSWGHGWHGGLGHGFTDANVTPHLINRPAFNRCVLVDSGQDFSCALDANSAVLMWGRGDGGTLGNGTGKGSPSPSIITMFRTNPVSHVCCGAHHSVAVTELGQVFTWGRGTEGQLGTGATASSNTPVQVDMLQREFVCKVSAGAAHTVVCTERHEVFSWGSSEFGQLGHGDQLMCSYPMVVEKLLGMGDGVATVVCGAQHTLALLSCGEVRSFKTTHRD